MRNLGFLFLLLTTSLLAQVNQKMSDGKWAYYGDEFYANFPNKISKDMIYRILNRTHNAQNGKFDTISTSCIANCYKHTSIGYDGARKVLFGELFIKKDSDGNFVQDVYCQKKFYFNSVASASNMHTEVNIEHTWPQSKFSSGFDKNLQKSDLNHLFLADSMANNRRANNWFGDIGNNHDELNVADCDNSALFHSSFGMLFTPPASHRGNVARALFYFAAHYNLTLEKFEVSILKAWSKADPVDQAERDRHEIIAKYQKVRNPFVDYPQLVDLVSGY